MKTKKILSMIVSTLVIFSLSTQGISAYSYDSLREDNSIVSTDISDNSNDIDVEYENTFENTYNTLSEYNGGISTYSTVNWSVKAGGTSRTTSEWTLKVDDFIDFDLTFSPALESPDLKIGLYNVNTGSTQYLSHSGGKMSGKFYIKTAGTYKLEVKNSSSQVVSVTGTVNFAILKDIGVKLFGQEKSNWCWAACSEMVSEYYGYSTTQTAIVTKVKGSVVNETGSPTDIKNAVEFATSSAYTTSGSYTSATGISNISNQINNSKPVIMFFVKSAGNHVCVATAVDESGTYVKYNDPSPVSSGKVYHKKYSELTTNSTNKYTQYMTVSKK